MSTDDDLVPEFLTPTWLSEVLHAEVRSFRTTRIGDGLVGMNLRLALEGDPSLPATVVAKLPAIDETSRATGIALRNYEREVKFYAEVASTIDVRVAKCHHASWDEASGDFVLLLEDLSPGAQGNQLTGCSVAQARDAVIELARMHGPRWDDQTLFDLDWLTRRTTKDDADQLQAFYGMMLPGFIATYTKYLDEDQLELVQSFAGRVAEWVERREGPMTVTHGDYRLDNLMFATPEGGYPVAVVDWQTPGHGTGPADLSYFLGAGLLPEERRTAEVDLVEEYAVALAGYGIDVDREWLWHQYRRDAFGGVIMAVVASQIVGSSERSEAMFAAMAVRHSRHALDVGSTDLI